MFEVGKQYKNVKTGAIIKVLFIGKTYAYVEWDGDGGEGITPLYQPPSADPVHWIEHTPPAVHTEECFVKWNELSGFHVDAEPSCFHDTAGTRLYGKIRFTKTEDIPLKVEVLE